MHQEPEEIEIQTPYLCFRGKRWGNPNGRPVLALHGWLDNAATYDYLAPLLPEIQLVAIDMAGHGYSDHRPAGIKYHFVDHVTDVIEVADALGWGEFSLLGHSMGASVSVLVAGTYSKRISDLILIEGLGPLSRAADYAAKSLLKSIQHLQGLKNSNVTSYASIEDAVQLRFQVGDMNLESVRRLVLRNIEQTEGGFIWRSDRRLKHSSSVFLTEEQVLSFIERIQAPTLLILGESVRHAKMMKVQERINHFQNIQVCQLSGGHHLHLDHPVSVAKEIANFLNTSLGEE